MIKTINILLLVGLISILVPPSIVQGQELNASSISRYQLADSYMRNGQFDRALPLLQDLYEIYPQNGTVAGKLKDAYLGLKQFDEAIALIDHQLDHKRTTNLLSERAALLFQKGDLQASKDGWANALALERANPNAYREVYYSMYQNRLYDDAIDVLKQGRVNLSAPEMFGVELAWLYSLTAEYEPAMDEYLVLLKENPGRMNFVKNRISRFISEPPAIARAVSVVEKAVRKDPLYRPFRELAAWFYMEAGNFDKAFDTYRAIDRLEQENGQVLYLFAEVASTAGAFAVASKAYREIRTRYGTLAISAVALFGLAETEWQLGHQAEERAFDSAGNRRPAEHFDQALALFSEFMRQNTGHSLYPNALQRVAQLQMDVFDDIGAAETAFLTITQQYSEAEVANRAQLSLGEVAVRQGDLQRARLMFSRLVERQRIGELAEQARLSLAELDFYEGQFESALSRVKAINRNTATNVSNDAITLKVMLIENRGPDSTDLALKIYAQALLLRRRKQTALAIEKLDELSQQFPDHALGDQALYTKAEIYRVEENLSAAFDVYKTLVANYVDSPFADRSLIAMAKIESDENQTEKAIQTFERVLIEYPGSMFISDVRKMLRELRGDEI